MPNNTGEKKLKFKQIKCPLTSQSYAKVFLYL